MNNKLVFNYKISVITDPVLSYTTSAPNFIHIR